MSPEIERLRGFVEVWCARGSDDIIRAALADNSVDSVRLRASDLKAALAEIDALTKAVAEARDGALGEAEAAAQQLIDPSPRQPGYVGFTDVEENKAIERVIEAIQALRRAGK